MPAPLELASVFKHQVEGRKKDVSPSERTYIRHRQGDGRRCEGGLDLGWVRGRARKEVFAPQDQD